MSSQLDAIKERHRYLFSECGDSFNLAKVQGSSDTLLIKDIPALVAAAEAVLELHEPTESSRHAFTYCCECSDVEVGLSVLYPCPTVQAIHQALGEGEQ